MESSSPVKGLRKELYSRGYTGISKAKKSVLQDMLLDALIKKHPDHGGDMEMMQFVNDLKAKLC